MSNWFMVIGLSGLNFSSVLDHLSLFAYENKSHSFLLHWSLFSGEDVKAFPQITQLLEKAAIFKCIFLLHNPVHFSMVES